MQGGGGHRDSTITKELRVAMLEMLIKDLAQNLNPDDQGLIGRLTLSAIEFETAMFSTATSQEGYERAMRHRPVPSITSSRDYTGNGPSVTARKAKNAAGPSTKNQRQHSLLGSQSPSPGINNKYPVRRKNFVRQQLKQPQAASSRSPSLPQIQLPSLSARHHLAAPSQQFGQQQINIISDHIYHQQQVTSQNQHINPRQMLPPQPHPSLLLLQQWPYYQHHLTAAQTASGNQPSPQNHQVVKNKTACQGSQTPVRPGSSRDPPIMAPKDNTHWHDIAYAVLRRCKEECLSVIELQRHNVSVNNLYSAADFTRNAEMGLELDEVTQFIQMPRSGLAGITKAEFYKKIEDIYKMKREMTEKHRKLTPPSPGQVSTSAVTEEQNELVPTAEAGGTQPVELQPVAVPESRDERQEVIAQSTPIDRLIKAVEAASAETLRAVARDVLAITTLTDQVHEAPVCAGGKMKRDIDAMVACDDFYAIDRLIDSGLHTLHSPVPKRQMIEVSGELMKEIELLNGSLIETQVAIVSPESGWLSSEADDEITLECAFRAIGSAASNELSHLFPVRMRLRIPRGYPSSPPTILSCHHGNCGQMCEEMQTKYQLWSALRCASSVKEFVEAWDECARELYSDFCSRIGLGSLTEKFGSWQDVFILSRCMHTLN